MANSPQNNQYWAITTKGKVIRRDKAKPGDAFVLAFAFSDGHEPVVNKFDTKEDAYAARDAIVDDYPAAFLDYEPKEETVSTTQETTTMPRKQTYSQEDFREMARDAVIKRIDAFWENWEKLKPADKCDYYYKMLSFAYSKAPSEKSVDSLTAEQRKAEAKRQAAAERISQGLPTVEDTNFEE